MEIQAEEQSGHNAELGAGEFLDSSGFDGPNYLASQLEALNESWKDRLTGKDFTSILEGYAHSRLALACYLDPASIRLGILEQSNCSAGIDFSSPDKKSIVLILIEKSDVSNFGDGDCGDDQVVLVDVVGLPDFPGKKVSSTVRFYVLEQEECESGECLHYATIRWSFGSSSGRSEGLTKRLPSYVGRKTYTRRALARSPHHASHHVIKGRAETVEGIPDGQSYFVGYRGGDYAKMLCAGLSVRLFNDAAEIAFDVGIEPDLRLMSMAIGPIDL